MHIHSLFVFTLFIICNMSIADTAKSEDWLNAITKRDTLKLEQLLPTVQNIDRRTSKGLTALMAAAARGDNIVVCQLLIKKAQPNLTNHRGGTALMYSSALNHSQTVSLLITHGADVNLRADNGWTALTLAAAKGNDKIVEKLLSSGANPNIPDVFGWTALMRAIEHERYKSTLLLTRHRDILINRINSSGQSALHIATSVGRCDLAQVLVDAGADTQLLILKNDVHYL
ncbi:MAG: ankyrin repeat domain-containing protein [Gammaproteobacteria bacterium]|nr:ankyrin repeat domain-containing protein [Gammaproteobacteria bacterium]